MFAYRVSDYKGHSLRVWPIALLIVLASLALTACGGDSTTAPEPAQPAAEPADTADADPEDLRVIENWALALSEGDVAGAADYFAQPSVAENGPLEIRIETREDAIAFNKSLPCAAEVISAQTTGAFTSATFRLADRPGGGCGSGAGGTASTSFVIEDGEIVEWRRIGDTIPADDEDAGGSTV